MHTQGFLDSLVSITGGCSPVHPNRLSRGSITPVSSPSICSAHLRVTECISRHRKLLSGCRSHTEFILVTSVIYLADSKRGTWNSFSCWSAMRLSEAILGFIDFTRVISGRCYNLISYQDIGETKRMLSEEYITANMDLQFICLYKGQDGNSFT